MKNLENNLRFYAIFLLRTRSYDSLGRAFIVI